MGMVQKGLFSGNTKQPISPRGLKSRATCAKSACADWDQQYRCFFSNSPRRWTWRSKDSASSSSLMFQHQGGSTVVTLVWTTPGFSFPVQSWTNKFHNLCLLTLSNLFSLVSWVLFFWINRCDLFGSNLLRSAKKTSLSLFFELNNSVKSNLWADLIGFNKKRIVFF